jgi:hypothetical protein
MVGECDMDGKRRQRGMWWCVVVLWVSGAGESEIFVKSCQRWRDCRLL